MASRRDADFPDVPRYAPPEGEGEAVVELSDGGRGKPDADGRSPSGSAVEERGLELAPEQLSPEALRGLVEEFVSREGTDYGHADRSLESKVEAVHRQLETGEARIVFDLESETASIVTTRSLERHRR